METAQYTDKIPRSRKKANQWISDPLQKAALNRRRFSSTMKLSKGQGLMESRHVKRSEEEKS
ncbi:MAG: hypothetical protein J6L72_12060 [Butyricicoccus sp.]|nr:hypothetical protein [Butyricicoccus sp.]